MIGKKVYREICVLKIKWVVFCYLNDLMVQFVKMSIEVFEDFYFDVCNLDYGKMSKVMDVLVEFMNCMDKVCLIGENIDLMFFIKDIFVVKCVGEMNILDGEVYMVFVCDFVNGIIFYNIFFNY